MPRTKLLAALSVAFLLGVHTSVIAAPPTLNVGSKRFTESYILGEILKQTARRRRRDERRCISRGSATPRSCSNALTSGSIDVYPEYTGTIAKEILKLDAVPPLAELNAKLAPMGLARRRAARLQQHLRARDARRRRAREGHRASSPISRRIPSCGWACRRNSSAAPTAGRD